MPNSTILLLHSFHRKGRDVSGQGIFLTSTSDEYMSVDDLRPILDQEGRPMW